MKNIFVEPLKEGDSAWVRFVLEDQWGSVRVVTRGHVVDASRLPGFKAVVNETLAGLVTYHLDNDACEVVTLDSIVQGKGIGTQLLQAVVQVAQDHRCRRVWLITTNDNLHALRFYQKRGFTLAALYPNALAESRKLKPEIPETGMDGLPLRDEIELELELSIMRP